MSADPLLQPYRLKHLTLRNRIIITAHEPAYPEDGMPKDLYRAYHVERAKAGVALTMTAGSASVSPDSPPVFNNILAYKDEVVPWLRRLADACHEQGAAVMIQLTHLGRRTRWDKADWLPVVSPSHNREAAHRSFPKKLEDWDIERILKDYVDAAERVKEAGLDGLEIQAYGHLMDQFWSPLTNALDPPYGGSLDNRLRFTFEVLRAMRRRIGDEFIIGVRYTGDELLEGGIGKESGLEISRRLKDSGLIDFLNVVRGHIDTDAGLTDVIPIQGMPLTNLGIRLVDRDVLEAADAFGSSNWQKLKNVQLPLAMPTIMAGINQTIMMALAMVVIASMIGVQGLGQPVLKAIANQYFTLGMFNGLAIVGIAIIFDRVSQAFGLRLQKHRETVHG